MEQNEGAVRSRETQGRSDGDRQTSMLRLAEQTVVEADKLAERTMQHSRKEAEEEASRIMGAARVVAEEQAEMLRRRAEREISVEIDAIAAKAGQEAQQIIGSARREASAMIQTARDRLPGIQSEARLEAEYIVRRFTSEFVEQLRTAVVGTGDNIFPRLDTLMTQTGNLSSLSEGESPEAQSALLDVNRDSQTRIEDTPENGYLSTMPMFDNHPGAT